jgi:hypothetical protein
LEIKQRDQREKRELASQRLNFFLSPLVGLTPNLPDKFVT